MSDLMENRIENDFLCVDLDVFASKFNRLTVVATTTAETGLMDEVESPLAQSVLLHIYEGEIDGTLEIHEVVSFRAVNIPIG